MIAYFCKDYNYQEQEIMSQMLFYRFISLKFIFQEDSTQTEQRAKVGCYYKGLCVKDLSLLIFIKIKNASEGTLITKIYFELNCLLTPNNLYLLYSCQIILVLIKGIDLSLTSWDSLLDHNSTKDHFVPLDSLETLQSSYPSLLINQYFCSV